MKTETKLSVLIWSLVGAIAFVIFGAIMTSRNSSNISDRSDSKSLARIKILEQGLIRGRDYSIVLDPMTQSQYLIIDHAGVIKLN